MRLVDGLLAPRPHRPPGACGRCRDDRLCHIRFQDRERLGAVGLEDGPEDTTVIDDPERYTADWATATNALGSRRPRSTLQAHVFYADNRAADRSIRAHSPSHYPKSPRPSATGKAFAEKARFVPYKARFVPYKARFVPYKARFVPYKARFFAYKADFFAYKADFHSHQEDVRCRPSPGSGQAGGV